MKAYKRLCVYFLDLCSDLYKISKVRKEEEKSFAIILISKELQKYLLKLHQFQTLYNFINMIHELLDKMLFYILLQFMNISLQFKKTDLKVISKNTEILLTSENFFRGYM